MAVVLVLAQIEGTAFWQHNHNSVTIEAMYGKGPADITAGDLSPFPFDAGMWPALQQQTPALAVRSCWGEGAIGEASHERLSSSSISLKVQMAPVAQLAAAGWRNSGRELPVLLPLRPKLSSSLEPPPWCPVRVPTIQLARRCLQRLEGSVELEAANGGLRQRNALPAWKCPTSNQTAENGKYDQKHRDCRTGHGMWGRDLARHLHCIALVVAEQLQMRPGDAVLDWGSGCGWMLSYFHLHYGALGYGVDANLQASDWSSKHSAGEFCLWDKLRLDWVPDSSFDHVVSYWALYHIRPASKLCSVARQLVRKLRPGGRAWFGGNDPSLAVGIEFQAFSPRDWKTCMRSLSRSSGMQLDLEFLLDKDLFFTPPAERDEKEEAYLYLEPTFSVLVTRRG